jgi:hypothetical protein
MRIIDQRTTKIGRRESRISIDVGSARVPGQRTLPVASAFETCKPRRNHQSYRNARNKRRFGHGTSRFTIRDDSHTALRSSSRNDDAASPRDNAPCDRMPINRSNWLFEHIVCACMFDNKRPSELPEACRQDPKREIVRCFRVMTINQQSDTEPPSRSTWCCAPTAAPPKPATRPTVRSVSNRIESIARGYLFKYAR